METYSYNQIKEEYGIEMLQQIGTLENISRRKGRYSSHLHFYLQCKIRADTTFPRYMTSSSELAWNSIRPELAKQIPQKRQSCDQGGRQAAEIY